MSILRLQQEAERSELREGGYFDRAKILVLRELQLRGDF
jgi:hypothetical protein